MSPAWFASPTSFVASIVDSLIDPLCPVGKTVAFAWLSFIGLVAEADAVSTTAASAKTTIVVSSVRRTVEIEVDLMRRFSPG
jgi:hypothetical protein